MSVFNLHGNEISSVFQLMGYKENDISKSTAWMFRECNAMLEVFISDVLGNVNFEAQKD